MDPVLAVTEESLDPLQPFRHGPFGAVIGRPVITGAGQLVGQILLGGADGVIRALRVDGTEVWRVRLWRPIELGPVPLSDGLLALGGNGDLHRFRR